jgi:hypothetical protein
LFIWRLEVENEVPVCQLEEAPPVPLFAGQEELYVKR